MARSPSATIALLAIVVALAGLGLVHSLWSQTLVIGGALQTGRVSAEFLRSYTNDDNQVDNPGRDSDDTGTCSGQYGEHDNSCDPREPGPRAARYDWGLATCVVTPLDVEWDSGVRNVRLDLTNVYPSYYCTAWLHIKNSGTVPVKVSSVSVDGAPLAECPAYMTILDGEVELCHDFDLAIGDQLEPEETGWLDLRLHVASGDEGANLSFDVTIELVQWNMVP